MCSFSLLVCPVETSGLFLTLSLADCPGFRCTASAQGYNGFLFECSHPYRCIHPIHAHNTYIFNNKKLNTIIRTFHMVSYNGLSIVL